MARKMFAALSAVVLALVLAVVVLPADSAAAVGGTYQCVKIRKGNYNAEKVAVNGNIRGTKVRGTGLMQLTHQCNRDNSMPITRMYILGVRLMSHGRVLAHSGKRLAVGKRQVAAFTPFVTVPCGKALTVHITVRIGYYNRATMDPYTFSGPYFSRC